MTNKYATLRYFLAANVLLGLLFAPLSFAGPGSQRFSFNDGQTYGSVLQIYDEPLDKGGQSGSGFNLQSVAYSEFNISRRTSTGEMHIANAAVEGENFNQVGITFNRLRMDAFNGYGNSVSRIRNPYSTMDAHLFHPGNNQRYEFSGFAVTRAFSGNVKFNFTQARITARGLEDRAVHGIGISAKNIDLRVMEVQRGAGRVGSVYSLSTKYGGNKVGFDYLKQENGASYQAIHFSRVHKGIHYRLGFQKTENPLYAAKNDNRAVFSLGFGFGSRASRLNVTEEPQQDRQINPYLIGAGAVGVALALSSGSDSTDNLVRLSSQHAAARRVLNEINPVSVAQNREFGGYIFRNADGSYSSTSPIRGEAASVLLPPLSAAVPAGGTGAATYHTHAAFDPRFDNENFSPTDIAADRAFSLDGYLATPAGAFKYHELRTGLIITLGTVAN